MSFKFDVRWLIALEAEARPIINGLKMTKIPSSSPFKVYRNPEGDQWLTISGLGQANAAAATAALHNVSQAPGWTCWVNVGIAGGDFGSLEDLFLVDVVTQKSTESRWFLNPLKNQTLKRASLLTIDQPTMHYSELQIFDMEAAAFVQIASKITARELICVLKILSDGSCFSLKKVTKPKVTELVERKWSEIKTVVASFEPLVELERERISLPEIYYKILTSWNFSETQVHALRTLTTKLSVINRKGKLYNQIKHLKTSRQVIDHLRSLIEKHQIDWSNY